MSAGITEDQAVLVAELTMRLVTDSGTPGAELRSIFLQALLAQGFELITHEITAGPLDGWVSVIEPRGDVLALVVVGPTGETFFEGSVIAPSGWMEKALADHQVLLLAGEIGLSPQQALQDNRAALLAAARAGQLAGGRVRCGQLQDFGLA